MSSCAAVLDACVLYPMYLRDTLLRAAESGLYRPYWSADILDEVRRNIVASGNVATEDATRLIRLMQEAFPEADVTHYRLSMNAMLNHPKDRHVTAAAVKCGAQVIVTDNLKDFPDDALAPFDLKAQSADTFLTHLLHLNAETMLALLIEQSSDYDRPPITALELTDRLAKHAPQFADRVRTLLRTSLP